MAISPLPEPQKVDFMSQIRGAADSLWQNVKRVVSTPFGQQTQTPKPIITPLQEAPSTGQYRSVWGSPRLTASPTPTPTPSPTPIPKVTEPGVLGTSIKNFWPPEQYANISQVLNGENRGRDPRAINKNKDGSFDIGIFQINTNTFHDFMRRKGQLLQNMGISSVDDLFDPVKNIQVAKLIWDEQGWDAWYGAPRELRMKQ